MNASLLAVVAGFAISIAATMASACSRAIPADANVRPVPQSGIDQALLDAAVRSEVNYHRCLAGLRELGRAQSALNQVAAAHSQWMARTRTLSHRSSVPGLSSLGERIRAANVRYRAGSENIAVVHRYRIDGKRFRIIHGGSCRFASNRGETIPTHTYASLARHAVSLWMTSKGHRKNILDTRVTRVSTAAAFGEGQYCGQFWLTQNFIG